MVQQQIENAVTSERALLQRASAVARPRVHGKFFYAGSEKLYIRGVTYGTFRESVQSGQFPNRAKVRADFASMTANGINAIRTYTVPPNWLLDEALDRDLYVMVGLPWEQHITFLDDANRVREIRSRVRAGVRECANHPAVLAYAIGNEIPAPIVRWHGRNRIQNFLRTLYEVSKLEDPTALVTYVNFPTTEYLDLDFLDFVSFNVYLETRDRLAAYLYRLQNLAGDRPLLMAEVGLDSRRNGEFKQAEVLDWQVRTVFSSGCAGMFVFAWTDEWHRGGFDIEDWDFGLVTRERRPKTALTAVKTAFSEVPFPKHVDWPRVTVVICSYNGSRTIRETLDHVTALAYPNYEVIVVDDGSTDRTAEIAREFDVQLISIENGGLSNARNVGMRAATGEIVAYCDDDAYPDPHWLHYLANTYMTTDYAGVGGPNLPPAGDGSIAEAVANAPGGPIHVLLSDTEAEHIPGCNSSYRRECLLAVNGYDPTYRVAGDDVDLCWRIQQRGWKVGFHPAALVWHHRRNSMKAYWKQQKGYGKAEALLQRKWPEKYNAAGHLTWFGRIYGNGVWPVLGGRSRVYHGTWGMALFQSVYGPSGGPLHALTHMPEWLLVIGSLGIIGCAGVIWKPLALVALLFLLAFGVTVSQSISAARRAASSRKPASSIQHLKFLAFTTLLFLLQPVARLIGRFGHGLRPWRGALDSNAGPLRSASVAVWSESWHSPQEWLIKLEAVLMRHRATVLRGGDFDGWDLEVQGGLVGGSRILSAVEEHGAGKQNVRWHYWPQPKLWPCVLMGIFMLLSASALLARNWGASLVLAALTLLFGAWVIRDCRLAQGATSAAIGSLQAEGSGS